MDTGSRARRQQFGAPEDPRHTQIYGLEPQHQSVSTTPGGTTPSSPRPGTTTRLPRLTADNCGRRWTLTDHHHYHGRTRADGGLHPIATFSGTRTGDPNLYTHVVIANKVQGPDGKWRSLDSRALHHVAVACSEIYDDLLADALATRLPVSWSWRSRGERRSPAFEIDGLDDELLRAFSGRGAQIEVHLRELLTDFVRDRTVQGVVRGGQPVEGGMPPGHGHGHGSSAPGPSGTLKSIRPTRSVHVRRHTWGCFQAGAVGLLRPASLSTPDPSSLPNHKALPIRAS
jgi:hypothetical protein